MAGTRGGHHTLLGSTGIGAITADNPREGFVGDPANGLYRHPTIVAGVTAKDEVYRTETFGPIVGVARCADLDEAIDLANGHGYGLSAAIYTTSPTAVFPLPPAGLGGDAQRQQLHERCGGAPALRRQRQVGQRQPPVGGLVLDQFTRWQAMNWDYAATCRRRRWTSPRCAPTRPSAWRTDLGSGRGWATMQP